MNILVLNAGSSSQKCSLYSFATEQLPPEPLNPVWEGAIDFAHSAQHCALRVVTASGATLEQMLPQVPDDKRSVAVTQLLETLWQGPTQVVDVKEDIVAVGHRVVHGGNQYRQAVWVDDVVKSHIDALTPLAPAHNPANLAGIEMAQSLFGEACSQYAVFDTAFHQTLPDAAALYPVPQQWLDYGIRRYGFHGISHQYCSSRAVNLLQSLLERPPSLENLRLVICHLGNGCSLSAVKGGKSIDTTMGFTPLDGLMMGTRSGSVDPGILTYLMREQGYGYEQLDQQLNKAAGLKGVSGLSGDMREIVAAMQAGNAQAQLAFDMYIHRFRSGIAAMAASLGGIDGLVFTAGVGEHATIVRAEACEGLGFLGLALSEERNMHGYGDRIISSPHSTVPIMVIHTREDWQIATEFFHLTNR